MNFMRIHQTSQQVGHKCSHQAVRKLFRVPSHIPAKPLYHWFSAEIRKAAVDLSGTIRCFLIAHLENQQIQSIFQHRYLISVFYLIPNSTINLSQYTSSSLACIRSSIRSAKINF